MPQFQNVSSRYGAPMGRHSDAFLETDTPRFVRLFRVRLDSGGYDDGGAYWGATVAHLWCAIDEDGNRQFVRAMSRESAALQMDIPAPALKRAIEWAPYALALIDGRAPMPSGQTRQTVMEWMKRCGARMGQKEAA